MNSKYHKIPLRLRIRSSWPTLVWIAVAVAAVPLVLRKASVEQGTAIHGVVGKDTIVVAPEETARVMKILVTPGQRVTKGQALVEMDTASIDHELAETVLNAKRLGDNLRDRRVKLLDSIVDRETDLLDTEEDAAETNMDLASERAELDSLLAEQARRDTLKEDGLIDSNTWYENKPHIAELQQRLEGHAVKLTIYARRMDATKKQIARMTAELDSSNLNSDSTAEIDAMVERIKADTERYRQSYTLTASSDGIVSEIRSEEGEVVRADSTIMRVVPQPLANVVALIPEKVATSIKPGVTVWITAQNSLEPNRVNIQATVEALAAEIRAESALQNVGGRLMPLRTRRAVLHINDPESCGLIAGEYVEVSLSPGGPGGLFDSQTKKEAP